MAVAIISLWLSSIALVASHFSWLVGMIRAENDGEKWMKNSKIGLLEGLYIMQEGDASPRHHRGRTGTTS
jgi:hypothetical protein